jgi:hypothetical protein
MAAFGTKRRNQILQIHVRFRGTAEVDRHPSLTASDAIDPLRTSRKGDCKATPWARSHSNLDLPAEFYHAVGRDAEELSRRQRIAVHDLKHLAPDRAHAGVRVGDNRYPADKE